MLQNSELMKQKIILILFLNLVFFASSQETNRKKNRDTKIVSMSVTSTIPPSLFEDGKYPLNLPNRKDYSSDDVYFKVIQGYINTNPDIINLEEATRMGFKVPLNNKSEDEILKSKSEMFRRKTPISIEEQKLKKEKEAKLKNSSN